MPHSFSGGEIAAAAVAAAVGRASVFITSGTRTAESPWGHETAHMHFNMRFICSQFVYLPFDI